MPYSTDVRRLEEMLPYLEPLARGESVRWPIKQGNANNVAFRVREALRIALQNKDKYPDLAGFAPDYKIRVVDQFTVEAIRRTPQAAVEEVVDKLVEQAPDVVLRPRWVQSAEDAEIIESIRQSPRLLDRTIDRTEENLRSLLGQQTPETVFDCYRRYGKVRPTLHFPDAALSDEDLTQLFRWASMHTPQLMLMVSNAALTVSIYDPTVAEFSWRPPEGLMDELDDEG